MLSMQVDQTGVSKMAAMSQMFTVLDLKTRCSFIDAIWNMLPVMPITLKPVIPFANWQI